jgi:hypothetical protein
LTTKSRGQSNFLHQENPNTDFLHKLIDFVHDPQFVLKSFPVGTFQQPDEAPAWKEPVRETAWNLLK